MSADSAGLSTLLLLVDGRLPSGGHAHSGGLEAAAELYGVHDVATMEVFLRGRLATAGRVAAAFAAASCAIGTATGEDTAIGDATAALTRLDAEMDARTPSPALRTTSRRLGRQLLRAGRAMWAHLLLDEIVSMPGRGPHQPVALGAVAAAAGLTPDVAALAAAHDSVAGPATAGVRLLGLDPYAVHAALARLAPVVDAVAAGGAAHAHTPASDLPACAGPLLDVGAQHHATWEVRLFAS